MDWYNGAKWLNNKRSSAVLEGRWAEDADGSDQNEMNALMRLYMKPKAVVPCLGVGRNIPSKGTGLLCSAGLHAWPQKDQTASSSPNGAARIPPLLLHPPSGFPDYLAERIWTTDWTGRHTPGNVNIVTLKWRNSSVWYHATWDTVGKRKLVTGKWFQVAFWAQWTHRKYKDITYSLSISLQEEKKNHCRKLKPVCTYKYWMQDRND